MDGSHRVVATPTHLEVWTKLVLCVEGDCYERHGRTVVIVTYIGGRNRYEGGGYWIRVWHMDFEIAHI